MKILSVSNYQTIGVQNLGKNNVNSANFGSYNKEIAYLQKNGFSQIEADSINNVLKNVVTNNPFKLLKKLVNIGRNPQDKKYKLKPLNSEDLKTNLELMSGKNNDTVNGLIHVIKYFGINVFGSNEDLCAKNTAFLKGSLPLINDTSFIGIQERADRNYRNKVTDVAKTMPALLTGSYIGSEIHDKAFSNFITQQADKNE